jgi:hypothetical protein
MLIENRTHPKYDLPTAVTFLFSGLALGWILTLVFFASGPESRATSKINGANSIGSPMRFS